MTATPDHERLIRAFLEEGVSELPERAYHAVRGDIERHHQRVVIGPWRTPDMNTFAKLAIAAAAVVVVALVGYNLLPSSSGNVGVGPPATASPSATAAPSPSITASPSATAIVPPAGPLPAGRHAISQNGIEFSLEFPAGWISGGIEVPPDGVRFTRADKTLPWLISWSIDGVYADPCGHIPADPVSPSAADLAAAVAGMPGVEVVTPPTDVTLGGRPAKHVAIRIPDDIGCAPAQFFLWYDDLRCGSEDPCQRWATSLRETNSIWIFEIDGKHVWLEYETYEDTDPEIEQELQQIATSIEFE